MGLTTVRVEKASTGYAASYNLRNTDGGGGARSGGASVGGASGGASGGGGGGGVGDTITVGVVGGGRSGAASVEKADLMPGTSVGCPNIGLEPEPDLSSFIHIWRGNLKAVDHCVVLMLPFDAIQVRR